MAGASPESIQVLIKQRKPPDNDFEVWEENWDSFVFFSDLSTQWRVISGMNGNQTLGLDYQGIEAAMRIKDIPHNKRADLFADVQMMELEALKVINKPQPD